MRKYGHEYLQTQTASMKDEVAGRLLSRDLNVNKFQCCVISIVSCDEVRNAPNFPRQG